MPPPNLPHAVGTVESWGFGLAIARRDHHSWLYQQMEADMQPRIDTARVSQDAYKAMLGLQSYVNSSDLEPQLHELVKIRASQVNGCAFCLHMHTRDARKAG
ncbi:MAG: carboxymuconolactone decarboxylase family protein [Acetobacteraceae bacterium]